jgi:hypothetical protein
MPSTFCDVSHTPPSAGPLPARQQVLFAGRKGASPRWLAHRPKVELDWPGVSRTALGVAQPRTGRHAYLNCRRRLDKANPDTSPVSGGASIARRTWSRCAQVHWCGGRLDTNATPSGIFPASSEPWIPQTISCYWLQLSFDWEGNRATERNLNILKLERV